MSELIDWKKKHTYLWLFVLLAFAAFMTFSPPRPVLGIGDQMHERDLDVMKRGLKKETLSEMTEIKGGVERILEKLEGKGDVPYQEALHQQIYHTKILLSKAQVSLERLELAHTGNWNESKQKLEEQMSELRESYQQTLKLQEGKTVQNKLINLFY